MIFNINVQYIPKSYNCKKIFLVFAISILIILVFYFLLMWDSVEGMVNMMESSGEGGIKQLVIGFQVAMINISYLLIITFCLVSVSSFIPSMLEKENIDLLLSKLVSRTNILLAKFAGGVFLIFKFSLSDWFCLADLIN